MPCFIGGNAEVEDGMAWSDLLERKILAWIRESGELDGHG